jgi:hypothetical protein
VAGDISGPTAGAVPKAGGAPGGRSVELGADLRHAEAVVTRPMEAAFKKCLRDFDMCVLRTEIVTGAKLRH